MPEAELTQPTPDARSPYPRDLKLALISIRGRYGQPRRSTICSGRGELSHATVAYHVRQTLDQAPPGLNYVDQALESYQVAQAKKLFGSGFDNPLEGRRTSIPPYPADEQRAQFAGIFQTLEWVAQQEQAADERLRQYNQSQPPATDSKAEEEILRSLNDFAQWGKSQTE